MFGVTPRTVSRWLKDGGLASLAPADVAKCLREKALGDRKGKPRGKPFRRGGDARRKDLPNTGAGLRHSAVQRHAVAPTVPKAPPRIPFPAIH